MDVFLSDDKILRLDTEQGGQRRITLMPFTTVPNVGDVVVTGMGTWEVLEVIQGSERTQLRVRPV